MVTKPPKKIAKPKTSTKSTAIGLRLNEDLRDYLLRRAEREGRSMSNLVSFLLTQIAEQDKWR
jgi:hypothetical protein